MGTFSNILYVGVGAEMRLFFLGSFSRLFNRRIKKAGAFTLHGAHISVSSVRLTEMLRTSSAQKKKKLCLFLLSCDFSRRTYLTFYGMVVAMSTYVERARNRTINFSRLQNYSRSRAIVLHDQVARFATARRYYD